MKKFIEKLKNKENLSFEESKNAFEILMEGRASDEEIYNSPNSSVRDIIEFVMPNVQRIHDPHGNDRVKIQGLDNKFVVFMIDGNRVSGEFAGNLDLSILSISNIDRIEIIRSGMSTLYGSDSLLSSRYS